MINTLVIGNGFDLYHRMKTKYTDFLQFLKELSNGNYISDSEVNAAISDKKIDYNNSSLVSYYLKLFDINSSKGNWIDMERELKELIETIIYFCKDETFDKKSISSKKAYTKYSYIVDRISTNDEMIVRNLISIFKRESEYEFCLREEFIDVWGNINQEKILKCLESELFQLEQLLCIYLQKIVPRDANSLTQKDLIRGLHAENAISFNYTDTLSKLNYLDSQKIIYVHGRLADSNVVLGYNDSSNEDQYDDIPFMKYYRRLTHETQNYKDGIIYRDDGYGGRVGNHFIFFGHSLDISDEDILKRLFEAGTATVYYLNKDDRAAKIRNMIMILGKEKALKQLENGNIELKAIPG